SEDKNGSESWTQPFHRFLKDITNFLPRVLLFRVLLPYSDLPDYRVLASIDRLVERYRPIGLPLSQLHQRFVYNDSYDPGVELGLTVKISQVLVGLQECFL